MIEKWYDTQKQVSCGFCILLAHWLVLWHALGGMSGRPELHRCSLALHVFRWQRVSDWREGKARGLVTSSNIEGSSWERKKSLSLSIFASLYVWERKYAAVCAKQVTDEHHRLWPFPSCTFGQWDVYTDRSHRANRRQGKAWGSRPARMLILYFHIN